MVKYAPVLEGTIYPVHFYFHYTFSLVLIRHKCFVFCIDDWACVAYLAMVNHYIRASLYSGVGFNELLFDKTQFPYLLECEPHREKTGFLPRRKQRRRSASR